jgi:hypothetical protein
MQESECRCEQTKFSIALTYGDSRAGPLIWNCFPFPKVAAAASNQSLEPRGIAKKKEGGGRDEQGRPAVEHPQIIQIRTCSEIAASAAAPEHNTLRANSLRTRRESHTTGEKPFMPVAAEVTYGP